jgi:hypothetical protein
MPIAIEVLEPGIVKELEVTETLLRDKRFKSGPELKAPRISLEDAWSVTVQRREKGSAVPLRVTIQSLLDRRLNMVEPLTLLIEQEGEFYIVQCEELKEFGYGYDPMDAVDDFRQTVSELYWALKEEQERLSPELYRIWERLTQIIHEL